MSSRNIFRRSYRRWFYPLISLLVALGLVVGQPYATSAFDWRDLIGPGIQVIQLSNLSDEEEVALGQEINQQIVEQVKLYRNSRIKDYVKEIGERLVPHSDRPNLTYTFQVVEDDSINAFATMGGFVYVNTGLLKAADNEAQVAGVMAHEIAHITNKHAIKQIRKSIIAQGIADAAGLERSQIVQVGVQVALTLPNSRRHELQADSTGLDNLVAAGYAASGMTQFFNKLMEAENGSNVPNILRTHPATEYRVVELESQINEKYPGKEKVGDGLSTNAYQQKILELS